MDWTSNYEKLMAAPVCNVFTEGIPINANLVTGDIAIAGDKSRFWYWNGKSWVENMLGGKGSSEMGLNGLVGPTQGGIAGLGNQSITNGQWLPENLINSRGAISSRGVTLTYQQPFTYQGQSRVDPVKPVPKVETLTREKRKIVFQEDE